jgi:Holliday junction resolvasome RuvABC endonuclease subunit
MSLRIRNDVLAIDPSLKATGYCHSLSDYGTLKFSRTTDNCKDIGTIYHSLSTLITTLGSIKYICKENYALGYHNAGMTRIMEVGGVIQLLCFEHDIKLITIAPTSIKKIITGCGSGKKDGVMREINTILNTQITDDNITDAVAIYLAGCGYLQIVEDRQLSTSIKVADLSSDIEQSIREFKHGMLR